MSTGVMLEPTLWRTCRVIANRIRLRLFQLLVREPGQTVSTLAARLEQSLGLTSAYLRALEARGLLTVRRSGRWVEYRLSTSNGEQPGQALAAALRLAFKGNDEAVQSVFRAATAFTHPRRVAIFNVVSQRPCTLREIQAAVGLSDRALMRHLRKLESREFVVCRSELWSAKNRRDALGRELARQACREKGGSG